MKKFFISGFYNAIPCINLHSNKNPTFFVVVSKDLEKTKAIQKLIKATNDYKTV